MLLISPSVRNSINLIKNHDEAIARWISHVISPHIVGVVITSVMAIQFSHNPLEVIGWLIVLMPLLVVPPLAYLLWLVRMGKVADIYLPKRETRLRPLTVVLAWLLLCLGLIRYWAAPPLVEVFVLSAIILVGILSLVTFFWKISFHGATITAAAMATVMITGSSAWPVMLLVPLVGWSRIRLERHTPQQVIFGSLVGALVALILAQGALLRLL